MPRARISFENFSRSPCAIVEALLRDPRWDRQLIRAEGERLKTRSRPRDTPPHEFLSFLHPAFPERLNHLFDPPCGLYGRGLWPILQRRRPWIGVVGTRGASAYALRACAEIVKGFVPYQAVVISGMASGIDACAHETALEYGLPTVGVLGTPLDVVYPRQNAALFRRMSAEALLLSELPSGAAMGPWRFPERNRIIAALCEALVVVEAPRPSGALVTAKCALELGREIFVVPGLMEERNEGAHRLVQQGAHLLTAPEEIFRSLGYQKKMSRAEWRQALIRASGSLAPDDLVLLELLQRGPVSIDKILAQSALPAAATTSRMVALVLQGFVVEHPGKVFEFIGDLL